jgi:hypothetical protein
MKLIVDDVWLYISPSCILFELHSFCIALQLPTLFNCHLHGICYVVRASYNSSHAQHCLIKAANQKVSHSPSTIWSSGECVFGDLTILFGFRFDDNAEL